MTLREAALALVENAWPNPDGSYYRVDKHEMAALRRALDGAGEDDAPTVVPWECEHRELFAYEVSTGLRYRCKGCRVAVDPTAAPVVDGLERERVARALRAPATTPWAMLRQDGRTAYLEWADDFIAAYRAAPAKEGE